MFDGPRLRVVEPFGLTHSRINAASLRSLKRPPAARSALCSSRGQRNAYNMGPPV